MPAATPLDKAASAMALYELDGSASRVARRLDMPRGTVHDIVNGYGRWSEVANDSSFQQLRQEQKRHLQAASAKIMSQALVRIEEKLPDASAPQAAMVYGILFDKDRLMAGESTQNVGVRTTNEILNLDSIADALRGELVKRAK